MKTYYFMKFYGLLQTQKMTKKIEFQNRNVSIQFFFIFISNEYQQHTNIGNK